MTLEEALTLYYKKFNKNYPLIITSEMSDEEIIDDIEMCIQSGKPAEQPTYEDDVDY